MHTAPKREGQAYKTERDAQRDERTKLMQTHYAGAIPLDLLASGQDRIARRPAFLEHAIYMSIDDSLRGIASQAYFDKLFVTADDTIHGDPGVPFNVFFDPTPRPSPSVTKDGRRNLELRPVMSLV